MVRVLIIFLGVFAVSCTPKIGDESDLKVTESESVKYENEEAETVEQTSIYKINSKNLEVHWFGCLSKGSRPAFLLMHEEDKAFEGKEFCNTWLAQTFLKAGVNVLAVNRPGFGKTPGASDFSGPNSIAAIESAIKEFTSKVNNKKPVLGAWGYSSGSIAAAYIAKGRKELKYLIIGSGIFDLEEIANNAKGKSFTKKIEEARKRVGAKEEKFYEQRSIAWDVSDLPNEIFLYHGLQDEIISPDHSKSFRDTLSASEYKVKLELVKDVSHTITENVHRMILDSILKQIKI